MDPMINELPFAYRSALYRGDGLGVAIVLRDRPVIEGSCWAKLVEPAGAITHPFVFLVRRFAAPDGRMPVSNEVFAVEGGASATLPTRIDTDSRLRALGEYFENEDIPQARRDAEDLFARAAAAQATIRANTFIVQTTLDGSSWEVSVSPTVRRETTLVLSRTGAIRHLVTSVPREELERAQSEPVRIETTERVDRPWFDLRTGRKARTVTVTLSPADCASDAPA